MKITKTASGHQLEITRDEWLKLGSDNHWVRQSQDGKPEVDWQCKVCGRSAPKESFFDADEGSYECGCGSKWFNKPDIS